MTVMEYNQLTSVIPKEWSYNKCKKNKGIEFTKIDALEIKIGLNMNNILSIRCKNFSWLLINRTYIHHPSNFIF